MARRFAPMLIGVSVAVLALGLGSCTEDAGELDANGGALSDATTLPEGCEEKYRSFVLSLHEAKTCTAAAECTFVNGETPLYEYCGAGYYVNASAALLQPSDGGPSGLEEREAALKSCFVPFHPGCFALPPPARCWRSKCWPTNPSGTSDVTNPDACFALSDQGACSECLCAARAFETAACLADPACVAILNCAREKGHLARYDHATANLPYPKAACGALFTKASASTQLNFTQVAYAASHAGCFAFCGPSQ